LEHNVYVEAVICDRVRSLRTPQRNATKRKALGVNTRNLYNVFDYCGAARQSNQTRALKLSVRTEYGALRCGAASGVNEPIFGPHGVVVSVKRAEGGYMKTCF